MKQSKQKVIDSNACTVAVNI